MTLNPVERFAQSCVAVVDGTYISAIKNNPSLDIFQSIKSGRSIVMAMTDQTIPEILLLYMYSVFFIGHYRDQDLLQRIQSYDTKNYVLMARLMRDLGVLITSSTKMTRLIRGSNYEGANSFMYLQFFIKYGENIPLSNVDDHDDHL